MDGILGTAQFRSYLNLFKRFVNKVVLKIDANKNRSRNEGTPTYLMSILKFTEYISHPTRGYQPLRHKAERRKSYVLYGAEYSHDALGQLRNYTS